MAPEDDTDALHKKTEVLARHLDAAVVNGISSTFAGDTTSAVAAWDRALTLGYALEALPLQHVDRILQTTAARLAAWEDVEEEVPGTARLLRRHRAPGRAKRPATALHRIVAAVGKACAAAVVGGDTPFTDDDRSLLVRALGALLAPGAPPPANESALMALTSTRTVDWETKELLQAAGLFRNDESN